MKITHNNSIYTYRLPSGERCYCIRDDQSGARAIFNYDKNIRKKLVDMLKKREIAFSLNRDQNRLKSWKQNISFAATMYALYHGLSREEMRGITVRYRRTFIRDSKGYIEDCRSGNIGTSEEIGDDNAHKRITHDDEYIRLELFTSGIVEYFTYSSGLYELLTHRGLIYSDDGHGSIKVTARGVRLGRIYHIAYAYYTGLIAENSTTEEIHMAVSWLTANDMTIDHADNNHSNNTAMNLSRMPNTLNRSKADIVTHFTPPDYTVVSIYMDGAYYIELSSRTAFRPAQEMREMLERGKWPEKMEEFTMLHNISSYIEACLDLIGYPAPTTTTHYGMSTIFRKCNTPEAYVEQLKDFASSTYSWTSTEATPQEEWRQNKGSYYWASNASLSLAAQKKLAEDVRERGHLFL